MAQLNFVVILQEVCQIDVIKRREIKFHAYTTMISADPRNTTLTYTSFIIHV